MPQNPTRPRMHPRSRLKVTISVGLRKQSISNSQGWFTIYNLHVQKQSKRLLRLFLPLFSSKNNSNSLSRRIRGVTENNLSWLQQMYHHRLLLHRPRDVDHIIKRLAGGKGKQVQLSEIDIRYTFKRVFLSQHNLLRIKPHQNLWSSSSFFFFLCLLTLNLHSTGINIWGFSSGLFFEGMLALRECASFVGHGVVLLLDLFLV